MNKRRKLTNPMIARLFTEGILHKEWDIRIVEESIYGRPAIECLAIGGDPEDDNHWYSVLETRNRERLKIWFPHTLSLIHI